VPADVAHGSSCEGSLSNLHRCIEELAERSSPTAPPQSGRLNGSRRSAQVDNANSANKRVLPPRQPFAGLASEWRQCAPPSGAGSFHAIAETHGEPRW